MPQRPRLASTLAVALAAAGVVVATSAAALTTPGVGPADAVPAPTTAATTLVVDPSVPAAEPSPPVTDPSLSAEPSHPPTPTTPTTPTSTPAINPEAPKALTEAEVRERLDSWGKAVTDKKLGDIVGRYGGGAILYPTLGQGPVSGEDISRYFEDVFLPKNPKFLKDKTRRDPIIIGDKMAIDSGVYVFEIDGKEVEVRYVFVYELKDGKWVITRHTSTVYVPPAKK